MKSSVRGPTSHGERDGSGQDAQLVVASPLDLVFRQDAEGMIKGVSPSVTAALGWTSEDLAGMHWSCLVHPDDRQLAASWMDLTASGDHSDVPASVRFVTKYGGVKWLSGTAHLVEDGAGEFASSVVHLDGDDPPPDEDFAIGSVVMSDRQTSLFWLDCLMDPVVILKSLRDDMGTIVDFICVEANEAACSYNHMTHDQLVGSRMLDRLPSLATSGALDAHIKCVESGEPLVLDDLINHHEDLGEDRRYALRGVKFGDGLTLTWRDTTDRQKLVSRPELAMRHINDVVVLGDSEGVITWISESVAHLLGWQPSELIGHRASEFAHPEDVASLQALAPEGERPTTTEVTLRIRCCDESYRWIVVSASRFTDESSGEVLIAGTWRDAQESTIANIERSRVERQYKLLAENAAGVVIRVDPHGDIEWVSPSIERVLEFEASEVIGTPALELLVAEDRAAAALAFSALRYGGPPTTFEVRCRTGAGAGAGAVSVLANLTGIRDDDGNDAGCIIGLVGIQDLAQERAARVASEERYRLIVENEFDLVIRTDLDSKVLWVEPSTGELSGWGPGDIIGQRLTEMVVSEDRLRMAIMVSSVVNGKSASGRGRLKMTNGEERWVAMRAGALFDDDGVAVGGVFTLRDIDAEVKAEAALLESEQRFRLVMESSPIGMVVADLDRNFIEVNPRFASMVGREIDWFEGHRVSELIDPSDDVIDLRHRAEILSGQESSFGQELRLLRADGTRIWVEQSIGLLRSAEGDPLSYVCTYSDISTLKQARDRLSHQATHDSLTRLLNRHDLFLRVDKMLAHNKRTGNRVGALYVDLDDLKVINDEFGHSCGDQVLMEVADRLTAACRSSDIIARMGGDEFVIVLPGLHEIGDAVAIAEKILEAMSRPVLVDDSEVEVTVSIGVTVSDEDGGQDANLILKNADQALYAAKLDGKARLALFDPSMEQRGL